jgi:hypothetical protein
MATYAQFFQHALMSGELIEACGDRSVIRLDGRIAQIRQELIAESECLKRGFVAWQLIKGDRLLTAKPITKVVSLYY